MIGNRKILVSGLVRVWKKEGSRDANAPWANPTFKIDICARSTLMGCINSTDFVKFSMQSHEILLSTRRDGKKTVDKSHFVFDSLIGEGGFGRVMSSMFLVTKKW